MDIRKVELPETHVAGIVVIAGFDDLWTLVPAAWKQIFARKESDLPDQRFAGASLTTGDGLYRETVGFVIEPDALPLPGFSRAILPAGSYIHCRHFGPAVNIADTFAAMYRFAEDEGLSLGNFKLDIGYSSSGEEVLHDLYVDIQDEKQLQGALLDP